MKAKIEVIMPRPTRRAAKEILGRLKERDPNIYRDVPPADLCHIVMTMWYYGYPIARRKIKV